jgi:glycosyltransferase involved in cell wall biosynthesis
VVRSPDSSKTALARSRIAVVGTRGIPARYGGFETLAEQLARHVDFRKIQLTVYGQRSAYDADERIGAFEGHSRIWMPLSASGAQSIVHDGLQLFHAAFLERHTHILILGTSAAWQLPVIRLFRQNLRVVTNIDGLEWRRDKFGPVARFVLKTLEKLAVKYSDAVIADNGALVPIVREIYGIDPVMIAYGADQVRIVGESGSAENGYFLAVARVEPENQTALILSAARNANVEIEFVGNWNASEYGRRLLSEYDQVSGISLRSPIYDQAQLGIIRAGSAAYVHGHSVGGTNPSLVEAIYHSNRVLAYDCAFNRATLDNAGEYFTDEAELSALMKKPQSGLIDPKTLDRLRARYRWDAITQQYLDLMGT